MIAVVNLTTAISITFFYMKFSAGRVRSDANPSVNDQVCCGRDGVGAGASRPAVLITIKILRAYCHASAAQFLIYPKRGRIVGGDGKGFLLGKTRQVKTQ